MKQNLYKPTTPEWNRILYKPTTPEWNRILYKPTTPEWNRILYKPTTPEWNRILYKPTTPEWNRILYKPNLRLHSHVRNPCLFKLYKTKHLFIPNMKVYSPKEVWFKQVSVYMYMKIQIVGKFKWSGTKMIIIKKNICRYMYMCFIPICVIF